jgi:DedD protein
MDQGLKERLIGAAVLVALGVWLIPWLLDGRQEQVEIDSSTTAVHLPAPDGPLPVRTQTLSLDAAKSEPFASEPRPEAVAPTASAAVDTSVAAAAPAPAPVAAHDEVVAPKQAPPPPVKAVAEQPSAAARVATAPTPAASKPAPKPAASAASAQAATVRGAWAVQLGSFGAEDNAKKLAQKVNVYGYKPDVAGYRAGGRAMYRVRLGPYTSRAEADGTVSALSAHGFAAQVVAAD